MDLGLELSIELSIVVKARNRSSMPRPIEASMLDAVGVSSSEPNNDYCVPRLPVPLQLLDVKC